MTTQTKLTSKLVVDLLYQALEKEVGLFIECEKADTVRTMIYKTRKELKDPALAQLVISAPASGGIFITKRTVELED